MAEQAYVAALHRELEGYLRMGNTDRAVQVRAELARNGVDITPDAPPPEPTRDVTPPEPQRTAAKRRRPNPGKGA